MRTRDVVRADKVANKAAAMAVGDPYPKLKPIALDEAKLDGYAGVYGNRQSEEVSFSTAVEAELRFQPVTENAPPSVVLV